MTGEPPLYSRRALLRTGALGGVAAAAAVAGAAPAYAAPRVRGSTTIVLTATVIGIGSYTELPFQVPSGVQRIDV